MPATAEILRAMHATKYVRGFTHGYYRYPAATSPVLARELISALTSPGDLVCDPFAGGGTVAVEALAGGRAFLGGDLNELAAFVSNVKTTPVPRSCWEVLDPWVAQSELLRGRAARPAKPLLPDRLERALAAGRESLNELPRKARPIASCALLRVGQWAVEARDDLPSQKTLHEKLGERITAMRTGMDELTAAALAAGIRRRDFLARGTIVPVAAHDLAGSRPAQRHQGTVKLLLTSPPYPGVHVLYHRWQVKGRRETAAPYWLIGARDGHFLPYYTMGGRSESGKARYFVTLTETFRSLRSLLAPDATVAVIVGFTDPANQEPLFHRSMRAAGFEAVRPFELPDDALVRDVPNRRWYARGKSHAASRELLLFYRPT